MVHGGGLSKYVVRRALLAIPLIVAVVVVNFAVIHLAPGDPVELIIGGGQEVDPELAERIRREWGLDRPVYEQIIFYLGNVLRGDLGYSWAFKRPVADVIAGRIPQTVLLLGSASILSAIVGIILGVFSSKRARSTSGTIVSVGSLMGYSLPVFWFGQILLLIFSLYLGWFPLGGFVSVRTEFTSFFAYALDVAHHLTLPTISLTLFYMALIVRITRTSMLEILMQDFITAARSKGLAERTVIYRHGLRNALIPVVTIIGMNFGTILAGAALTETVFAWPGLGRLAYESILRRDQPLLLGIFVIVSLMVIVTNLITDILYGFLDPRIRYK